MFPADAGQAVATVEVFYVCVYVHMNARLSASVDVCVTSSCDFSLEAKKNKGEKPSREEIKSKSS